MSDQSDQTKIVLFIFAGREANMRIQEPYLDRILTDYPQAEVHLWDLTRTRSDAEYLASRDGAHEGRVKVMRQLHPGHPIHCLYPNGRPMRMRGHPPCRCMKHKPPFEKPYQWYAKRPEYTETVFMKVDDDVLFLETDNLDDLIAGLSEYPERVYSANVVNNAVCAKYDPDMVGMFGALGDPTSPDNDRAWWALHIEPLFARLSHLWFLKDGAGARWGRADPWRTREGEAISINCIAFTHTTMQVLTEGFLNDPRLGDEGAVDALLPWIVPTFRAAHLTFGPQEQAMSDEELDGLRSRYAALAKEYLA